MSDVICRTGTNMGTEMDMKMGMENGKIKN